MMIEQILTILQAFSEANGFKTFDYGEEPELMTSGSDKYPMVYVEEPFLGTYEGNTHSLEFSVLMLDMESGYHTNTNYKDNTPILSDNAMKVKELKEALEASRFLVEDLSYMTLRG